MSFRVKGAIIAVITVASVGITGAIVPQLQTLSRNGPLSSFPTYVIVGSAVVLAMLVGFFIGRHKN